MAANPELKQKFKELVVAYFQGKRSVSNKVESPHVWFIPADTYTDPTFDVATGLFGPTLFLSSPTIAAAREFLRVVLASHGLNDISITLKDGDQHKLMLLKEMEPNLNVIVEQYATVCGRVTELEKQNGDVATWEEAIIDAVTDAAKIEPASFVEWWKSEQTDEAEQASVRLEKGYFKESLIPASLRGKMQSKELDTLFTKLATCGGGSEIIQLAHEYGATLSKEFILAISYFAGFDDILRHEFSMQPSGWFGTELASARSLRFSLMSCEFGKKPIPEPEIAARFHEWWGTPPDPRASIEQIEVIVGKDNIGKKTISSMKEHVKTVRRHLDELGTEKDFIPSFRPDPIFDSQLFIEWFHLNGMTAHSTSYWEAVLRWCGKKNDNAVIFTGTSYFTPEKFDEQVNGARETAIAMLIDLYFRSDMLKSAYDHFEKARTAFADGTISDRGYSDILESFSLNYMTHTTRLTDSDVNDEVGEINKLIQKRLDEQTRETTSLKKLFPASLVQAARERASGRFHDVWNSLTPVTRQELELCEVLVILNAEIDLLKSEFVSRVYAAVESEMAHQFARLGGGVSRSNIRKIVEILDNASLRQLKRWRAEGLHSKRKTILGMKEHFLNLHKAWTESLLPHSPGKYAYIYVKSQYLHGGIPAMLKALAS